MALLISVLDSSAMLAYARAEVGGEAVLDLLTDPAQHCHAHAVNVCEVYYDFLRGSGPATADAVVQVFLDAGVTVHEDVTTPPPRVRGFLGNARPTGPR